MLSFSDHRLVIDREQLLGSDLVQRVKTGAGTTGKNDALHNNTPSLGVQKPFILYHFTKVTFVFHSVGSNGIPLEYRILFCLSS